MKVFFGIQAALSLLWAGFLSLFSPYRYEWDPALRQVDDDKALVLCLLWAITVLLQLAFLVLKARQLRRRRNTLVLVLLLVDFAAAVYAAAKLISILLLYLR